MAVVIPALDARFFTTISLDEYFVNKDTGLPLANGRIRFFEDTNRNVPKLVYTLADNPPAYNTAPPNPPLPNPNYPALPNPITLSAVGQPSDNNGNNVPIYYFPYDAAGNLQLYYIVIEDQFGTVQETRHAWPNIAATENPATQSGNFVNALSNPQFTQMLFSPNNPLTITNSAGAGLQSYFLFPDWQLNVIWSGNGTIVVTRTAIAGSANLPGNPPFTITITPGVNITQIQLYQMLNNNPNLFAASGAGIGGYISASLLLGPGSSIINMLWAPNGLGAQSIVILTANNTSGSAQEFTQTTQLPPGSNAATGDTGFVNIAINLPVTQPTTLSNVQIIGLQAEIEGITWSQYPANRQADQLFNYWQAPLNFKPIPSYLIGWDFPFNPTQFLGPTVGPILSGNNTSFYAWDQTILFQTLTGGVTARRNITGTLDFQILANGNTQFAMIQYLPQTTARALLQNDLSVNIIAGTAKVGGLVGTVSLWYTNNGALPSTVGANASLVTALDANGFPTVVAGWNQVPRNVFGNAVFTLTTFGTFNLPSIGFNGWNINGTNAIGTTTFFAIVVGFGPMVNADQVDVLSISLVPGKIPTIPAPKSFTENFLECCHYYQKSFSNGTVPAQNVGLNSGDSQFKSASNAMGAVTTFAETISFISMMAVTPIITFYNPGAANAQCWDYFAGGSTSGTVTIYITPKSFVISTVGNAGAGIGDQLGVHWTADARLGQ